jgi:hypothetical protein
MVEEGTLSVGPNSVVDIKWNDVEKRGDFALKTDIPGK